MDAVPEPRTATLGPGGAQLSCTVPESQLRAVERDILLNAAWLDTAREVILLPAASPLSVRRAACSEP